MIDPPTDRGEPGDANRTLLGLSKSILNEIFAKIRQSTQLERGSDGQRRGQNALFSNDFEALAEEINKCNKNDATKTTKRPLKPHRRDNNNIYTSDLPAVDRRDKKRQLGSNARNKKRQRNAGECDGGSSGKAVAERTPTECRRVRGGSSVAIAPYAAGSDAIASSRQQRQRTAAGAG